jgi:hypothetical protein
MFKIRVGDETELEELLDADGYAEVIAEEEH